MSCHLSSAYTSPKQQRYFTIFTLAMIGGGGVITQSVDPIQGRSDQFEINVGPKGRRASGFSENHRDSQTRTSPFFLIPSSRSDRTPLFAMSRASRTGSTSISATVRAKDAPVGRCSALKHSRQQTLIGSPST